MLRHYADSGHMSQRHCLDIACHLIQPDGLCTYTASHLLNYFCLFGGTCIQPYMYFFMTPSKVCLKDASVFSSHGIWARLCFSQEKVKSRWKTHEIFITTSRKNICGRKQKEANKVLRKCENTKKLPYKYIPQKKQGS